MALSSSKYGQDLQDFIKKDTSALAALTQFHKYFSVSQKENTAGIAGGKCVMSDHENGCSQLLIDTLDRR